MQALKTIGKMYRIIKPLFQVRSYLYVQVCSIKNNYDLFNAALYIYENQDPSQCLKMLSEKLDINTHQQSNYLIFPNQHIKEVYNDKNISIFFINDYIVPLQRYDKKSFENLQYLQMIHDALTCLNQLHMRDIVHGNISIGTSYLIKLKNEQKCRFAFNILDTSYFTEQDCFQELQGQLFQSQGQSLGLGVSFKDDLQSLVYVIAHLISKGNLFTLKRFQLQWISDSELLRWKNCQFFKELINIIPEELEILIEIYTMAKSLRRNEKPDYVKLIKKVLDCIAGNKRETKKRVMSKNNLKKESESLQKLAQECRVNPIHQNDIKIEMALSRTKYRKSQSDQNQDTKSGFVSR